MARRPEHWPAAKYSIPFAQKLVDIGSGLIAPATSDAKQHHFVPRFILRRFQASDRTGYVYRRAAADGAITLAPIKTAASEEYLYGVQVGPDDGKDNGIEAFIGEIENDAAPALKALADPTVARTQDMLITVAVFMQLQRTRTPEALESAGREFERYALRELSRIAADPEAFAELAASGARADGAETEVEELRASVLDLLTHGGIELSDPRLPGMSLMIDLLLAGAEEILAGEWILLTPETGSFITNDRCFCRVVEEDGLGLTADAYPVAPNLCILTLPSSGGDVNRSSRVVAEPSLVHTINARIAADAERYAFAAAEIHLAEAAAT